MVQMKHIPMVQKFLNLIICAAVLAFKMRTTIGILCILDLFGTEFSKLSGLGDKKWSF